VPDVVHNGTLMPAIAGRVYLFGPEISYPLAGNGAMVVELFDDTRGPAEKPLEQWQLDPVTLKKLLKKDMIGWGYSLVLPWGSCRPDVTKVRLTCRYDQAGGTPLFAQPSPVTLEHEPPVQAAAAAVPAPAPVPPPPAAPPQRPVPIPMPTPVR